MKLFLDTNFVISLIVETEFTERARNIVEKHIEDDLVTSVTVVEETLYVLRRITGRSNEEIAEKVVEFIRGLEIEVLRTLPVEDFFDVFRKYDLLPNDALIAATCRHYGIGKIATFDKDFKRVDFLEVISR